VEVQLNDKDISTLGDETNQKSIVKAYIVNGTNVIESITLQWNLDDDAWIVPGKDLAMPGFNTIKASMAGFKQAKAEETTIKADGDDKLKLIAPIKDGKLDLDILYTNGTAFTGLGEDSNHEFITANGAITTGSKIITLNDSKESTFVVTWISDDEAETYAYRMGGITSDSGNNKTTLDNLAGGKDITFSKVDDDEVISTAGIKLKLETADQNTGIATINVTATSGTVYLDKIVTKEGMKIQLPFISVAPSTTDGAININATVNATAFVMNVTEENSDNNVNAGESFTVTINPDASDGPMAKSLSASAGTALETEDGSDKWEAYVESEIATKTLLDKSGDAYTLTITYPGEESYADVYLSELAAQITVGDSPTTPGGKTIGNIIVRDSQVSSVANSNLLVVGGSCINTVAAKILGSNTPVCGAQFTTLTGVEAGQYVIKTIASPYATGKVATLVAGYEMAETSKAATDLVNNAASYQATAGMTYKGTLTTVATAQTA
jgi:uncharacterized protein YqfB (UPF0267 family)